MSLFRSSTVLLPDDASRTRRAKRAAPEESENENEKPSNAQPLAKAAKTVGVLASRARAALVDISNNVAGEKILTRAQAKAMEKPEKGRKRNAQEKIEENAEEEEEEEDDDEDDVDESADILSASLSSVPAPAVAKTPAALIAEWEANELNKQTVENTTLVYAHLKETEAKSLPNPRYMDRVQGDLSFSMRAILVDWLVEVAEEYNLQPQTLFLSVAYVDRFLDKVAVDRSKLQLVGITSMLLAAKYWEIYPPTIEDFVYISDNTYNREQVVAMESAILSSLKFGLTVPTAWDFSKKFGKAAGVDKKSEHLIEYFLELFLQESAYLMYKPSMIAAAGLFLAQWTLQQTPWNSRLQADTGYKAEDLQACVRDLQAAFTKSAAAGQAKPDTPAASQLKAVREKFSHDKFLNVASIKPRVA